MAQKKTLKEEATEALVEAKAQVTAPVAGDQPKYKSKWPYITNVILSVLAGAALALVPFSIFEAKHDILTTLTWVAVAVLLIVATFFVDRYEQYKRIAPLIWPIVFGFFGGCTVLYFLLLMK